MEMSMPEQKKLDMGLVEAAFRENYEKLYACAFRLVGNRQDAEDVLQNAFLKAYKNIEKFRNESKLSTWIYRILVNESYRYFQSYKKLPVVHITEKEGITEEELFASMEHVPELDEYLILEDMREKCLQGFLKCLPKQQRVCFLLKSCLELSNKDIGEVMEISTENVKVTLHRGRKRLKEMFNMRCSLIDPEKPCKCHLWIKFMRDRNLKIPEGYQQIKSEELKKEHFKNLNMLRKMDYLYSVEGSCDREEFIRNLKKAVKLM